MSMTHLPQIGAENPYTGKLVSRINQHENTAQFY